MNPTKVAAVIGLLINVPVWALTGHLTVGAVWFAAAVITTLYLPAR